jgi:hypothetical protein
LKLRKKLKKLFLFWAFLIPVVGFANCPAGYEEDDYYIVIPDSSSCPAGYEIETEPTYIEVEPCDSTKGTCGGFVCNVS